MRRKLLIVNNGLKDLRGHYFETGKSVAEAAEAAGIYPYLLAHADCAIDLLASEPDLIPLCRTDHWMAAPPVAGPRMEGIRCDLAGMTRVRIDEVLAGTAELDEYLQARFEPTAPFPPPSPQAQLTQSKQKRSLKAFLPPIAVRLVRTGKWGFRRLLRTIKACGRGFLPPILHPRARSGWRGLRRLARGTPPRPQPAPAVVEPPVELPEPLEARLTLAGFPDEFEAVLAFQDDLERAIGVTGLGPADHVFLPTAHGRELAAVHRLVSALGAARCPTFHLEFRHAIEPEDAAGGGPFPSTVPDWLRRYTTLHQVYFDWSRHYKPTPRVRAYTDTEELTEEYARFSGLPFGTLPIPFRTERIVDRVRRPGDPICIAYLGDVRDEKGFPWLPALVEALRPEAEAGRVRFLFQASLTDRRSNPRSARARRELRRRAGPYLELPGLAGPLGPDEYFGLVSAADVVLCPYCPTTYARRSSGTLTEGIAAGVPTVVPAGTWLARQQPPGTGTAFADLPSFVAAVREVVAGYDRYAERARAFRSGWHAVHNPGSLVNALLRAA